jgi:hypothetical protein
MPALTLLEPSYVLKQFRWRRATNPHCCCFVRGVHFPIGLFYCTYRTCVQGINCARFFDLGYDVPCRHDTVCHGMACHSTKKAVNLPQDLWLLFKQVPHRPWSVWLSHCWIFPVNTNKKRGISCTDFKSLTFNVSNDSMLPAWVLWVRECR